MTTHKYKTLVLKRCYFEAGFNGSLEQIITAIVEKLPKHEERTYDIDLFKSLVVASIESSSSGKGSFIRILGYEKGAKGLINLETSQEVAEVEEHRPPSNREFLDEEMVLYVADNHIIACGLSGRDNVIGNMIAHLGSKAGVMDPSLKFKLGDVPNKNELDRLQKIGVKYIDLSISSYLTNLEQFSSVGSGLASKAKESQVLKMIFGSPSAESETLRKRSSTHGKIILSRGKFKKAEIHRDDWLTNIGQNVIESYVDDYTIELEDGSRISTSKLKVSKSVRLTRYANSVALLEAKNELIKYHSELSANGSLEW